MGKDNKAGNASGDRHGAILNMLRVKRSMKIAELQDVLGVSDMTVRRCLNEMAAEGLIKRTHGGASMIEPWEKELAFQNRVLDNIGLKMALATQAQSFIPDGGSIYLDGGTTCYEVAKQLCVGNKKCTVITDSLTIPRELLGKSGVEVILLGGQLCADGNTLDGSLTAETASRISVDLCVISCDGFNNNRLEVQGLAGAQVKKLMLRNSALSLCVTAACKYNKQRCFHFCAWEEIDMFLTDSGLPEAARSAIAKHGVEIHIIEAPGE